MRSDWNSSFIKLEYDPESNVLAAAEGTYTYCGLEFPFSVRNKEEPLKDKPDKGKMLNVRGTISLMAPDDSGIMLAQGDRLRSLIDKKVRCLKKQIEEDGDILTAEQVEKLKMDIRQDLTTGRQVSRKARKDIKRLRAFTKEEIEKAIEERAEQIVRENMDTLVAHTERLGAATRGSTAIGLWKMKGRNWKYSKKQEKLLENISFALGERRIEDITKADAKEIYARFGRRGFVAYRNFLGQCDIPEQNNPFYRFPVERAAEKSLQNNEDKALEKATRVRSISQKEEARLNELCMELCRKDGRALIIVLAKDFYLSAQTMASLTWKDVLVCDEGVFIRRMIPESVGALHNFTAPLLPFGQTMLKERMEYLLSEKRIPPKELEKMPVLTLGGKMNRHLKTSQVTEYLREVLKLAGVKASVLEAYEPETKKKAGGAGLELCHDHYRNVLRDVCMIDPISSSVGRFLCGLMPGDTTNLAYRDFTGPSGRWLLATIVQRDRRFVKQTEGEDVLLSADDNKTLTIGPGCSDGCLGVLFEIQLRKGEHLEFTAPHGLRAEFGLR